MYMNRSNTVATFSRAGKDHSSVVNMSCKPLALGTSLMMRNTRNTRRSGNIVTSEVVA